MVFIKLADTKTEGRLLITNYFSMAYPRLNCFAEWFKDQWESEHMNYLSIWKRYSNYSSTYKDDYAQFTPQELVFLLKMHKIAIQSAKEKNFHLLWDRVDSIEDFSLYEECDGLTWYWPQFMAKLLDRLNPTINNRSRLDELNQSLQENDYETEPEQISKSEWLQWRFDF